MDKWRQECEKTRDELETQLQRMKQEKSASEAELKGDLDSLRKELDSQRDRAQQVHKARSFVVYLTGVNYAHHSIIASKCSWK